MALLVFQWPKMIEKKRFRANLGRNVQIRREMKSIYFRRVLLFIICIVQFCYFEDVVIFGLTYLSYNFCYYAIKINSSKFSLYYNIEAESHP